MLVLGAREGLRVLVVAVEKEVESARRWESCEAKMLRRTEVVEILGGLLGAGTCGWGREVDGAGGGTIVEEGGSRAWLRGVEMEIGWLGN